MRYMVMVKATPETEAGVMPTKEELEEMGRYNEELVRAGVMLAGEGLRDSSHGVRVHFDGDKRTVVDGPFTEAKELVAGFWILDVKSRDEAIEWAKRIPFRESHVEVRKVFDDADFADIAPENFEREKGMREEIQRQHGS